MTNFEAKLRLAIVHWLCKEIRKYGVHRPVYLYFVVESNPDSELRPEHQSQVVTEYHAAFN